MNLSEEQILALAPDESSKKSGKDLSNPSKWVSKGANEIAIWGEAQGSGSKPYQTQIDTINIAFKCSCPSRKFPCKHGLGLLLFHARQKNSFTDTEAPAWVTEWLGKRTERQEKKVTKEEKPVDEAAQAKRQQARQQKVSDGIEELLTWMKDIVRNGLHHIPAKGSAWFDNIAKRMVDAQAPGLANMIRDLSDINFYAEGWQHQFMDQFTAMYLVCTANKELPESDLLHQDIRSLIGYTQNQEELKEQTGITDTWLVLAKQTNEVDNITTEKFWLLGSSTNRYALILQFIVRGQGGQLTLTPGMFIQAELVFYPSTLPLRAIIKRQLSTNADTSFSGFNNWKEVAVEETNLCATLPIRYDRPFIVKELLPVRFNNQWWLKDNNDNLVQIKNSDKMIWNLLALSGGHSMDMAVIGKEDRYQPIGVWHNNQYKAL